MMEYSTAGRAPLRPRLKNAIAIWANQFAPLNVDNVYTCGPITAQACARRTDSAAGARGRAAGHRHGPDHFVVDRRLHAEGPMDFDRTDPGVLDRIRGGGAGD